MDPDSPTELPPPAYDAQDFDRKVSVALDRSMDPALQTITEEWEEWSEERFEAAAAAYSQRREEADYQSPTSPIQSVSRQNSKKSYRVPSPSLLRQPSSSSSSSSFSGQTFTFQATGDRSRRLPSSPPKERPSWYKEAHLDLPARPDSISAETHRTRTPPAFHHELPPDDDFVDDEPLPPFAPVGPSLDGPPYPELTSYPPPRSHSISPPRPSYYNSVTPPAQRRPANQSSFRHRPVASQPFSNPNTHGSSSHNMPPMPFDAGLAYARQRQATAFLARDEESGPVDPALLYNSAVSSVMKKSRSMQPLKKSLPNRERSNDLSGRRSFDTQSTRSSYTDNSSLSHYQGDSYLPRITQYAIPTLPTLATQSAAQSFPGNLPTLPTLQPDDPRSHQADTRNLSSYYSHSSANQWSQSASSYGPLA